MIFAIIRPEKFNHVKAALEEKRFFPMTVSEVRGRGEQKGIELDYRGKKMGVDLLPKVKIELCVPDTYAETVVHIIRNAAWTGKKGDGKIFVLPVEMSIRVRDEEPGRE